MSYSTFEYTPVRLSSSSFKVSDRKARITAEVTVKNVSGIDGMETVHWFICDPYSSIARPVKELKFFEKRLIKAGESETFTFEIDPLRDLGFVNGEGDRFLEKGEYHIIVKSDKAVLLAE